MKYALCGLLLLAACLPILSKKDTSSIVLAPTSQNNCQTVGLQCYDCETIQYCSEDKVAVFQTKCSDQSKGRPFCDAETNSCVKVQPTTCDVEEQKFVCPGVGTYPDLDNCNNYYICDDNKEATNYACSIGYIYSQEIQACVPGFKCKSYSSTKGHCKDKINKLIAYAPSKDLYVLCLSGQPSLLFQCPVEGDIFVEEEVACRFECTENGFFPYRPDSSKFYSCMKIGKKFTVNLLDCPEGTEFVELGLGQGICTIKTTTSTTTEAVLTTVAKETTLPQETTAGQSEEQTESNEAQTTVDQSNEDQSSEGTTEGEVEGSGESPEDSQNETNESSQQDVQQEELLREVFEAVNELSELDATLQNSSEDSGEPNEILAK